MTHSATQALTPMLCSRFLKPEHAQRHGRAYTAIENGYLATLGMKPLGTTRKSATVPSRIAR
ncbi:MAG: efflux RND transporter permease subunit, partial [Hydrogenophaga sp.]|nr:efflux RND transporter permease subunit [Hydrogenophaga sp.]